MNDDSKFECCICMESEKDLILLKCFHKHVVCIDCSKSIKKCPICRSEVTPKVYEAEKEIIEVERIVNVPVPIEVIRYIPQPQTQNQNILKPKRGRSKNKQPDETPKSYLELYAPPVNGKYCRF